MTTTTQPALVQAPQKLSSRDGHLLWLFMRQTNDLPLPTRVEISAHDGHLYVSLRMPTCADVEAWAEVMGVDAEHELNGDQAWSDRAEGHMTVFGERANSRRPTEDSVHVEVWHDTARHPVPTDIEGVAI